MSLPATLAPWSERLQSAWARRGLAAWLLLPVAGLYAAVVALRRTLYRHGWLRSHRVGVPVAVIGNVVVGGAGKTPTVIAVVRQLRQLGWHPGVISRGYGRRRHDLVLVNADARPHDTGDEPLLIHRRTGVPVVVCRDRVAAAQALLKQHPDVNVILSDDGLQHLRLARDVEVLVFDERGAGNGWWLPAGPLRESAARPVDLVLYNAEQRSTPRPGHLVQRAPGSVLSLTDWQATAFPAAGRLAAPSPGRPLADWRGRRVLAAAGIAKPQRFFDMLEQHGLTLQRCPLPDHFDYASQPWMSWDGDAILVTEKDAIKLATLASADPRIHVVTLDFEPEAEFFTELERLLLKAVARAAAAG